ncbi:hypothetical protein niasHT_011419 [Heterodera trifolii]|uniref:Uncharacterized protein n=1 Tax=Heterodera trifolii TaxID=157864 RepID=A0ABD2LID5_9BILA
MWPIIHNLLKSTPTFRFEHDMKKIKAWDELLREERQLITNSESHFPSQAGRSRISRRFIVKSPGQLTKPHNISSNQLHCGFNVSVLQPGQWEANCQYQTYDNDA